MISEFPRAIHEKLKYYVYLYVDPRDDTIFYVGKGNGNRAFAHLDEESDKQKVKRIRDIQEHDHQPRIDILIHGIEDDETAKRIEASVIDLIGIGKLTNLQRGYESRSYGRMSLEQIIATYASAEVEVTDPVVIININRSFRYGMSEIDLYDATRSSWVIGDRRSKAKYALATYQGIVQEVYELKAWFPANSTFNTRKNEPENNERWEFIGKIAANEIRNKYLLRDISKYLGAQNPIRYVNCE
jgi:hypothetical protein